jgi:periplasmic divalent cation tolerance protein
VDECQELDILAVTTTVGSVADGQRLARDLVAQRLAACVQVEEGLTSFYRWEGRECEDPEVRLTIKTLPGKAAALQAFFVERHPYDVPQFLCVAMRASAAYAAWVREQVA